MVTAISTIVAKSITMAAGVDSRSAWARARKPAKSAASGANKSADTAALERRLSDTLGLTVTLAERGNSGVLHIHYRSLDQLDDVVRRLEKN